MEENGHRAHHYALLRVAQQGEGEEREKATEQLLLENMGLVRAAARGFRDRGTEYEDLMQIGAMGMLRAIRTFDLSRGTAFSTFAVPLIVGEIKRHLRDNGIIRVSRTYKQLAAELTRHQRELLQLRGVEPSLSELAALCNTTPAEAAVALSSALPVASLSENVFEDEKGELAERITDDESANEPAILNDRLALREAIGKMPALWRRILLLRYFRNRTQQETADLLGLSQVKVSREEKKILTYLRGEMIV